MGLGDLTDDSIGLDNGCLLLPARELCHEVFEPVVSQVLTLIGNQLQQSPNLEAIFLVGGFGQSNYLFRRVEDIFADKVGMIGVPPRGELAVVRGAVYFGLNPTIVTERISRRTYGVETRMLFQNDVDPPELSVIGVDGRTYCRQRFSVYVHKGQSVRIDECVSKTFVIGYPNDTDSDLYAYDGDGPGVPRLTTDSAIQKVGHFPIRMPHLEGVKPGDKVTLTIRMYFGLTEIKIECVIKDQIFTFTSAFDAADAHTQASSVAGYLPTNNSTFGTRDSPMSHNHAYPLTNPTQSTPSVNHQKYPPNMYDGQVRPPSRVPSMAPSVSSPSMMYNNSPYLQQQYYNNPQGYYPTSSSNHNRYPSTYSNNNNYYSNQRF